MRWLLYTLVVWFFWVMTGEQTKRICCFQTESFCDVYRVALEEKYRAHGQHVVTSECRHQEGEDKERA